jgi:hypothetical protein
MSGTIPANHLFLYTSVLYFIHIPRPHPPSCLFPWGFDMPASSMLGHKNLHPNRSSWFESIILPRPSQRDPYVPASFSLFPGRKWWCNTRSSQGWYISHFRNWVFLENVMVLEMVNIFSDCACSEFLVLFKTPATGSNLPPIPSWEKCWDESWNCGVSWISLSQILKYLPWVRF